MYKKTVGSLVHYFDMTFIFIFRHPIIKKLSKLRESDPKLATLVVKQLLNNAMVSAGLVEDPRTALTEMNELLTLALEKH